MPMSRYEIRNEYSLADPDLYRTADKDDPEALLEGVAVAGLVGVLRQLGDLAEFAAEIFHNLHEEVMATAARGHGLMTRVQQLETEVPSIERAFLSQTDHSSFFYHTGLDWHPSQQVDQNLITQGDLPRFIMDSYEECRAPPRLFLLDKFDVGGAGACLKRYTDPSFFKVEASAMAGLDVQREKKIRKGKKKGPRWRNGETQDVLPTSHAKLHQLFLEERVENGVSTPSHRAKLKRKLNAFPFNSKTGKSYMEKILNSTSPDHKVLYEVDANSLHLMLATNGTNKSDPEVRSMSADRGSVGDKRSPPLSPDREEIMLNHTMCQQREIPIDANIGKEPNSCPRFATDGISSTLTKVDGEKVISVDAESCREGSLTGYQSDAISSEVENYVDAPSTIESEMDTDRELKVKSSFTSSHVKDQPLISKANEEDHQTRSSDAQSTGGSTISDDGNNSSRKEISSFCSSDSPSTSADNPEVGIIGGLSHPQTDDGDFPLDQHSKPLVSDAITNHRSDFEQLTSSLCSNEAISAPRHPHSGVEDKDIINKYEADEIASTLEDEEKKTNLATGLPGSSVVSDVESQSGDDSPRSDGGEIVNEPNGDIQCQARHSTVTMSLDLLHEDRSYWEDSDPVENIASTLRMPDVPSQSTTSSPEMISSENLVPGELDDESPKLPENLDHEDSEVSIDNPDNFPYNVEDSLGIKPADTSSAKVQIVDAEDNHSNISLEKKFISETLTSSFQTGSPDEDGTLPLETYHSCEVEGLQGTLITDSEALESSCSVVEGLHEPPGASDAEISADLKSTNDALVLLNESESEADKSNSVDMASAPPAVSDIATMDSVYSLVEYHGNLVQEQIQDSGLEELENDDNHLSEGQQEPSRVVELSLTTASGFENDHHPEAEISDSLSNLHHDLGDEFEHAASGSGTEGKIFQESGSGYHIPDAPPSWHVDYDSEQSLVQEKISILPSQIDDFGEIRTESSSSLPFNHQEMPDHDGDNDSTSTFSFIHCDSAHSNDPLRSIVPPINPFSEINQINLGELAPLPPLPPVQWRMGKLQHSEAEMTNHKEIFPRLISPITPSNDVLHSSPPSNDDVHASPPSIDVHSSPPANDDINASSPQSIDDVRSPPPTNDVQTSPPAASTDEVKTSLEETKKFQTHIPLEPLSKEENVGSSCSGLETNFVHKTIETPPERENTPSSEIEITTISEENGIANGSQEAKMPHPRNPLVENVAALDKSKLRKVTERVRPQIQKVDERDSLLEQIRTKSFNLRPTMASRPSIRGPNTNLKVAAILEKANAIRQAFVGSDEDDDDSWSD